MAAVEAGDRQAWLDLFADDAVVEDPVGPSPFDPEGSGHRGIEAIAAFYDNVIAANESMPFTIHQSFLCGDEAANVGVIRIDLGGGAAVEVDGVYIYRRSPDGQDRLPARLLGAGRRPFGVLTADRGDGALGPTGQSQPVNPYCWWGPITAHSNMP